MPGLLSDNSVWFHLPLQDRFKLCLMREISVRHKVVPTSGTEGPHTSEKLRQHYWTFWSASSKAPGLLWTLWYETGIPNVNNQWIMNDGSYNVFKYSLCPVKKKVKPTTGLKWLLKVKNERSCEYYDTEPYLSLPVQAVFLLSYALSHNKILC